jgi:hypothetical protein
MRHHAVGLHLPLGRGTLTRLIVEYDEPPVSCRLGQIEQRPRIPMVGLVHVVVGPPGPAWERRSNSNQQLEERQDSCGRSRHTANTAHAGDTSGAAATTQPQTSEA